MTNQRIKVISANISKEKGTIKQQVPQIELTEIGVTGDAHAGLWHRQVSLLGTESVEKFEKMANRKINYGEFAENITTKGMLLYETLPLDTFISDTIELEVTQIGKECHGNTCAIFREVGNCVMPKEGIFCRVKKGGLLKADHEFEYVPRVFKFHVITLSDRASKGVYEDLSGPKIIDLLTQHFDKTKRQISIEHTIIPDNPEQLALLLENAKNTQVDFVITTGGTGIGPKDITPDVIHHIIDKEIPGIMDMIRLKYGASKPNALLSRSVAGVMDKTCVFAIPGSVKAVNEYIPELIPFFNHLLYTLNELDLH